MRNLSKGAVPNTCAWEDQQYNESEKQSTTVSKEMIMLKEVNST